MNKKLAFSYFIIGILLVANSCFKFDSKKITEKNKREEGKGFAVVELFTSEGCSSCPPADEAVGKLLKRNIDKTYILSFHVDYWNRLGWKDKFSKQEYTARQGVYAKKMALESIYTPQIIVNGTSEFVGSNEIALNNAVNNGIKNGSLSNLNITVLRKNNSLTINYNIIDAGALFLNCAIVLPEANTQVKRGENGGRNLKHVNVVMDLKIIETKGSGELTMDIPKELIDKPFKVIAFSQAKQNLKILGADEVNL